MGQIFLEYAIYRIRLRLGAMMMHQKTKKWVKCVQSVVEVSKFIGPTTWLFNCINIFRTLTPHQWAH